MFIMPSFKKSLIVEQFLGNYLNRWIAIYPVDSAIQLSNNRGLADRFAFSYHLSVGQCVGYYKEKILANHLWDLKG